MKWEVDGNSGGKATMYEGGVRGPAIVVKPGSIKTDSKNDIGEQTNFVGKFPERVEKLDALIEQHLIDTKAVRPLPNPAFDPSKYDVTKEGKAGLKGVANTPRKGKGKPADNWAMQSGAMSSQALEYSDWYLDGKRNEPIPIANEKSSRRAKPSPKDRRLQK